MSLGEKDLSKIQGHWDHVSSISDHKDGLDRDSFCNLIVSSFVPAWENQTELLEYLFNYCSKTGTVVTLVEWTRLIECFGYFVCFGCCLGDDDFF